MYSYDLQITSGTDWQAIANLGTSSAMSTSGGSGGLTAEQATQLMKTATKADVINAAMM